MLAINFLDPAAASSIEVSAPVQLVFELLVPCRNALEAMRRDYKTDAELAAGYFAMARAVFLRDGYHSSILFLLRNRRPIRPIQINVENVQQKYVVMRQLADKVTKSGADAVITIDEVWLTRADELKPYERPADSLVRTEALVLNLVSKSGEPLDFFAKIIREGKNVSLGKTEMSDVTASFMSVTFYQAWGRPVPQAWIDTGRTTIAAARQK